MNLFIGLQTLNHTNVEIQIIEKSYMSIPIKAIPLEGQDQQDSLSSKPNLHEISQSKLYDKPSRDSFSTQRNGTCGTNLLIMFLIVCLFIMSVKYFELRDKDAHSQFNTQQTQVYSQPSTHDSAIHRIDQHVGKLQFTMPGEASLHSTENQNPQQLGHSTEEHEGLSAHQKPSVSQDLEANDQNSPQLKTQSEDLLVQMAEAGTAQIDSDEGQLDGQGDDSSNEEDVESVKQNPFLNDKDVQKVDELHTFIDEQFELHPKAKFYNQIPLPLNSQIEEQTLKKQPIQNLQEINEPAKPRQQQKQIMDDKPIEDNNRAQIEKQKIPAQKPKSPIQMSQQDMYDPIIRVKDKMEKNFKAKFEDLIYIKAGTKITESQYSKARERMSIWKFFNPATGNLELLDEVEYESSVTLTPLTVQKSLEQVRHVIRDEQLDYEEKYHVSQYQEIPFCIIIPSYKNQDKYLRNLNSILQQDYQNYHIVYIDDASHDGTAQKVINYIKKYNISQNRLKFIQNSVNKKALPNIDYAARRLCQSGQIMAIIDGDDYLIGTQVFKLINARYQKENLLALYTNHLRVHEPIYLKVGTCIDYPERVKKGRAYRRFSIFPASHLRTFYVDLYWRINIRDLKDYKGQYFTAANDFAIMMPILEMSGNRFQYLPELTYVYDAGTGFNNFQTKADTQAKNYKITKRRHRYPKLVHSLEFSKKPQQNDFTDSFGTEPSPGSKLRQMITGP